MLGNILGDLSLPTNSVVRLTGHPDMTIVVYCGCKATKQQITVKIELVIKQFDTWYIEM